MNMKRPGSNARLRLSMDDQESRGQVRFPLEEAGSSSFQESNHQQLPFFGAELIDDAQLAKEMNDLSVKERELVYDDVHGVAKLPEETPDFISGCMQELDTYLAKIPQNKRKWLDRAFFLKRGLENDRGFKLMFLRANRYDAESAAAQMASYFKSKVELFGEEKIVKRITLDDLDEDTVKRGYWRNPGKKDRAGRLLVCSLPGFVPEGWKNNTRYAWYQTIAALQDEETQIKGMVYILAASDVKVSPKNFIEVTCMGAPLLKALPSRWVGFHICHNHPSFKAALAVTNYMLGKDIRIRARTHYGSILETQYALMTFGIPKDAVPVTTDHVLDPVPHEKYIQGRRRIEREWAEQESSRSSDSNYIPYPKPRDVLVGRGRPFQEHIGNIRYLELVDANMLRYKESTDRNAKSAIFRDVVRAIHSSGGRFLRCQDGKWVEAPETAAREKVSHSFRHRTPYVSSGASTSSTGTSDDAKRKRPG